MASSGNFCTMNPLVGTNGTLNYGNLYLNSVSYPANLLGTMGVSSGKWYFEARCTDNYGAYDSFGVIVSDNYTFKNQVGNNITESINWHQLDTVRLNGVDQGTTTPSLYNTATKIVGCALDLDNNKVYFHGNNTYVNSHNPNTGSGGFSIPSTMQGKHFLPLMGTNAVGAAALRRANFGQDSSFGGDETAQGNSDGNGHGDFYYAPPTGFLAMCTANLPISDDIDPNETDDNFPQKQFNTITYTGNGGTNSITGLGFQPDMVWIKSRTSGEDPSIYDSTRGVTKRLKNATTEAESTVANGFTAFGTDGFTVGAATENNANTENFVAWCWRANGGTTSTNNDGTGTSTVQANQAAGFSIVQFPNYSGDTTFGHGLSKTPEFIIAKLTASGSNFPTFHSGFASGKTIHLNTNTAEIDSSHFGHSGTGNPVSSTTFTLGASFAGSGAGIAYVWHSVEGYSKFGKFEGNSNADGPFVYTGFRPRLVFCKAIDATENWQIRDTARHSNTGSQTRLYWNSNTAEGTASTASPIDFLANGFKIRGSNSEINTNTIIYGAWGDVPFKYNNTHP